MTYCSYLNFRLEHLMFIIFSVFEILFFIFLADMVSFMLHNH